MYKERRVGGGSKPEMGRVGDRKRLNEALDKHLERSSPSTSTTTVRGANGKDHRFALSKSKDQLRNSAPPPDNKCSDGIYLLTHIIFLPSYFIMVNEWD